MTFSGVKMVEVTLDLGDQKVTTGRSWWVEMFMRFIPDMEG